MSGFVSSQWRGVHVCGMRTLHAQVCAHRHCWAFQGAQSGSSIRFPTQCCALSRASRRATMPRELRTCMRSLRLQCDLAATVTPESVALSGALVSELTAAALVQVSIPAARKRYCRTTPTVRCKPRRRPRTRRCWLPKRLEYHAEPGESSRHHKRSHLALMGRRRALTTTQGHGQAKRRCNQSVKLRPHRQHPSPR